MPKGVYERSKTFDVTDAPQDHKDVEIPLEGDVGTLIQEVETYGDTYSLNDKAAELAFMEEPVKIFLYEGSGPNDIRHAHLQINGESPYPHNPLLMRGMEHTIKRKFVQRLGEMRTVAYTQPLKGHGIPEQENLYRPQVSMSFPFSIIHDGNNSQRAQQWRKKVMGM
jgi:hypothetical protein